MTETPPAASDESGITPDSPSDPADQLSDPSAAAGASAPPADKRATLWRRIVAIVLIVIATVLAPVTVAVLWMNTQLLNTDNYVAAVAPLSKDPAVRQAVATDLTNGIWSQVNVDQQLQSRLPSWAQVFAAPLSSQLKDYAYKATYALVSSDQFSTLWQEANRRAHARVTGLLLGEQNKALQTQSGEVYLDLSVVGDRIKSALDARGIHVLDSVTLDPSRTKFVLFRSHKVAQAQKLIKFLNTLRWVLPILLIAAWAGAIAVSTRRRRTVLLLGFFLAVVAVLVLVGYNLGRGAYLDKISSPQLPRAAAAAIFDTMLTSLKTALRTTFVVGLVVWLGALLAGPAWWAVRLRHSLSGGFEKAGGAAEAHGVDLGPVGGWVAGHHRALQLAGVIVAAAVLVFWGTPGVAGVVWTVVILLLYLAVVEFVGRLTPPAAAGTAAAAAADVAETTNDAAGTKA